MISDWQYRSLSVEIGTRGFRTSEPNPAPREMSLALEKILEMLRAEGVTRQGIARELGWPLAELNAFMFGLVLSKLDGQADVGTNHEPSRAQQAPSKLQLME